MYKQLWDLAAGKSMTTLTQHKKAVRSLAANPRVRALFLCDTFALG